MATNNGESEISWAEAWRAAEEKAAAYEESQDAASDDSGASTGGKGDDAKQQGSEGQLVDGQTGDSSEDPAAGGKQEVSEADAEQPAGEGADREGDSERSDRDEGDRRKRDSGGKQSKDSVDRSERIAALREQAKELGYEFNGNRVEVADRVKLRQERRDMRQKVAQEKEAAEKELERRAEELEKKYARAQRLEKSLDSDDLDGFAESLGHKNFVALNEYYLKKRMSPEHKEIEALKREKREREERAKKESERQRRQSEQQALEEQRAEYLEELADEVRGLKDESLRAWADDRDFVSAMLHHQQQEWDGHETISAEEAARRALADARRVYERFHPRFGDRAAAQPEKQATGEHSAEKNGRKRPSKNVSQAAAAEASEPDNSDVLDEKAWQRKWATEIGRSDPVG